MENKQVIAYIHNLSPIKTSGNKSTHTKSTYFDMQLQTENNVVRGVCFSSTKHSEFQAITDKKSPVKLQNFDIDKKDNTSVLMGAKVRLSEVPVSFAITPLPSTVNLASLTAVNENQLVTLNAKLTQLSGTKRIDTKYGLKKKASAFLIDPYGGLKIDLWEDFINEVKEGGTYTFANVRVRKDNYTGNLSVTTPNSSDCTITECEPFTQTLATPAELPETFLTKTIEGEFIGVNNFNTYYSCCKCNSKITDIDLAIVKCLKCNLNQKLSKCAKHCYLNAFIEVNDDTSTLTVTLFDQAIKMCLALAGKDEASLNEKVVTEVLLSLPPLSISYNRKTKIVASVESLKH